MAGLLGTHGFGEVAGLAEGLEIIPRVRISKKIQDVQDILAGTI